jgi:hypothetical protein
MQNKVKVTHALHCSSPLFIASRGEAMLMKAGSFTEHLVIFGIICMLGKQTNYSHPADFVDMKTKIKSAEIT